ncbi:recombinase family protein [Azonexus sp.]|uniref:recombinase family protein n=1 Tax=Azonexus sp. TaxID=1872668 RepID=UPI0035AE32AB
MHIAQKTRPDAPKPGIIAQNVAATYKASIISSPGVVLRIAVYARYSTDGQKETSIDDQIRCCAETAERYGLSLSEDLVFADDAITGTAKATHKREQYHALRLAVRSGDVNVIICDQQCRLARSAKEALEFFEELKAHGVRLLTADGFDSEQATAQLLFGIKSVFAEFFIDETRHRVCRGMLGEFERGAMVTAVPYGYKVDVVRSADEGRCVWAVNEAQADVVREVFRLRKEGMSLNQIAAVLNLKGEATPNKGKYWGASAIQRLLKNSIYKGYYVVNFSAEKGRQRPDGQRLMSELALVSSADWNLCQSRGMHSSSCPQDSQLGMPRQGARASYGSGKHPLAGVIRCGTCDAYLSRHGAKSDTGTMHCSQCDQATRVGVPGRQPLYISVKGVRQMLNWLLQKVVTGEAVERYRDCLRQRLDGGREAELLAARSALDRAERSRERFGRLLRQIGEDDPVLEKGFLKAREDVLTLERKVQELEHGLQQMNQDVIRRQLDIDLSQVVEAFLSDQQAPERTRFLLNRIFPSIVLEGKIDRFTAIFRVEVKLGAILAEASGTDELASDNEILWVRLRTSGPKHPTWSVEEITAAEADAMRHSLGH